MKLHLGPPANAQRRESIAVLQVSKQALNRGAATVKIAEPLRVTGDAREQSATEREREGWLIRLRATERDDRVDARSAHSAWTRLLS
jgi:hypothetical protein